MKRCIACGESFEDGFRFCPFDRTPFTSHNRTEPFHLTLVDETRLMQRLATEVTFLARRVWESRHHFKEDPAGFTKTNVKNLKKYLGDTLRRPYAGSGLATGLAVVTLLVLSVVLLDKGNAKKHEQAITDDDLYQVSIIESLSDQKAEDEIGAGEQGRVGFNRGKGEGSNPRPARAQGGGGGGMNEPNPQSQGRLPVPSEIPAPITKTYARLPSLPDAGLDIDPALWRNLNFASYGDPQSKSTAPSNGPGEGGGVGIGKGTGIGEGEGSGFGRGRNGNIGDDDNQRGGGGAGCGSPGCVGRDQIYKVHDVAQRPRVLFKPEPQYTEAARKNATTGTVILRVVFSSSGEVTNIQALQKLGDGLTEKAIAAARQIRFVPATRNGQPVSMYMQLEYNFNLY